MQLSDGMLVKRCLDGDKEAFGFLVDRYKESVFGLAYSKVGNIHDAQDISQEAFINAYKNLRQFRHPYKFHSWLYTITANCCKMFFRKRAKERTQMEYLEKLPVASLTDESLRKHQEAETRQSLLDAIASLPEDARLAMTLYYINDLSGKEIAEFMGISHSNVRVKLHRGRKLLGKELLEMAERRVGTTKIGLGFTFDILESIKHLTPKPIPKPKSPFIRALPWGASLAAALVLGIFGGLGVNLGGSDSAIGNSIVPANWIETELFIEKPGLAETASVDKNGTIPISDLPQIANPGGEKRETEGGAGAGQLPTVEEIAHKMGYLFGDIKDIKFTTESTRAGSPEIDRRTYEYMPPDKSRVEAENLISVDNGDIHWYCRPDDDDKLFKVFSINPKKSLENLDITPRGLLKLPEAMLSDVYSVKLEGKEIINGKEMLILRFDVKKSSQTPLFVYAENVITTDFMIFAKRREKKFIRIGLDPKTCLPIYQEVDGQYSQYRMWVSKTKQFGGITLPVEYEGLDKSGRVRAASRIKEIQLDTNIRDDRFEVPAKPGAIVIDESLRSATKEALQGYEQRIKSEPNNVALRYALVNGHRYHNPLLDADALRRHTEKLLELAPDSISVQYGAGEAYMCLDEPKKALTYFQKAASAAPKRWGIHSLMGQAYEQIGLIDESIREYKIELRRLIDTESWLTVGNYYGVGSYYGNRPNHEERGISTKLAVLCHAHNRLEQLIEEYQQQIENSPENICLQRLLGDAYYHLGDNQNAVQAYRRMFELIGQKDAIEASSTSWEFANRLKKLGLHRELADYYQIKFDSGDFDSGELEGLIRLYAELGETDKMIEIYNIKPRK